MTGLLILILILALLTGSDPSAVTIIRHEDLTSRDNASSTAR